MPRSQACALRSLGEGVRVTASRSAQAHCAVPPGPQLLVSLPLAGPQVQASFKEQNHVVCPTLRTENRFVGLSMSDSLHLHTRVSGWEAEGYAVWRHEFVPWAASPGVTRSSSDGTVMPPGKALQPLAGSIPPSEHISAAGRRIHRHLKKRRQMFVASP